jgi:hypothetical protein
MLWSGSILKNCRFIEMITALGKVVDSLDICNFIRRHILNILWSDHRILKAQKTFDLLCIS